MRIIRLSAGEEAPVGAPAINVLEVDDGQYTVRVTSDEVNSVVLGTFNHPGLAEWEGLEALAEEGAWCVYINEPVRAGLADFRYQ